MHDKLKEKKGTNITYSLNDSGQQSNSESTSTTATTTTTVEEEGLKNDNSLSRNQSSFFKFKKMDVQTLTFQDALDALLTAHSNEVNTIRLEMMKKQTLYERELSMAKAESAMEFDKTYWEGEIKKRDEKIEDLSNKLEESQKIISELVAKVDKRTEQVANLLKKYGPKSPKEKWRSSNTQSGSKTIGESIDSLEGTQERTPNTNITNNNSNRETPNSQKKSVTPNDETGSKRPSPTGGESRENKKLKESELPISPMPHRVSSTLDQVVSSNYSPSPSSSSGSSVSLERVADTYQESLEILPFYSKEVDFTLSMTKEKENVNETLSHRKLVEETQEEHLIQKTQKHRVRITEPLKQSEVVILQDSPPKPPQRKIITSVLNMRKKADRAKMDGTECDECKNFYDALGDHSDRKSHLDTCSKHRVFKQPTLASGTPPDFWDMNFPSQRN